MSWQTFLSGAKKISRKRHSNLRFPMPPSDPPPLNRLPFEPPPSSSPELMRFWDLWREEKFWACHEALEDAWRHEPDASRKRFLRGLIHGAVAVFQFRRGNFVGAARQLSRARVRLRASLSETEREGVDVARFLEGIAGEVAPAMEALSERERAGLQVLEARLWVEISERGEPGRAPGA